MKGTCRTGGAATCCSSQKYEVTLAQQRSPWHRRLTRVRALPSNSIYFHAALHFMPFLSRPLPCNLKLTAWNIWSRRAHAVHGRAWQQCYASLNIPRTSRNAVPQQWSEALIHVREKYKARLFSLFISWPRQLNCHRNIMKLGLVSSIVLSEVFLVASSRSALKKHIFKLPANEKPKSKQSPVLGGEKNPLTKFPIF